MPDADLPPYDGLPERLHADIGVIGGSGFYSFLAGAEGVVEVPVATPWGRPSDPLVVGELAGRRVAFVPRHGRDHRFPPHRVPYRANLWALRAAGVRQVVAPCAVGSLKAMLGPGAVVVPDQLVDRTSGRVSTYSDADDGVAHVSFADPYCPRGRATAVRVAAGQGLDPVDGGTLVVVNGPRFSTRAESRWHAAQGWAVVGMTGAPEAALARELALCYTTIALVTDLDAGVETGTGVSQAEVFEVFAANIDKLRRLLDELVPALPGEQGDCPCGRALDGVRLPYALP